MIQLAEVGTPDLMCFKTIPGAALYEGENQSWRLGRYVSLFFIEVKRPKMKATLHQTMKMKELESFGAKCFVATSIEDVEEAIT